METEIEKFLNTAVKHSGVGVGNPMEDLESLSPLQMLDRDILKDE